MSIINEALKKAQANLEKKQGKDISKIYERLYQQNEQRKQQKAPSGPPVSQPPNNDHTARTPPPPPPTSHGTNPSKPSWNKKTVGLIYTIFIFIGIVVAIIIYKEDLSSLLAKKSFFPSHPYVPRPESKQVYNDETFIVSGTMMMDDKRVALINGEVYEVGESINGKQITNITLEKIELLDNGNVITLSVK